MRSLNESLPVELTALVHNIELHRSGWWEKAVQCLVLSTVWTEDKPHTVEDIVAYIETQYRTSLSVAKISTATRTLESQGVLLEIEGGYRIADDKKEAFETDLLELEATTAQVHEHFSTLLGELCPDLDDESTWRIFESEFLTPLITEVGANAYRLIAGKHLAADGKIVQRFLGCFDKECRQQLRELVPRFLDPKNNEVKKYVSRLLHASFCVKASGLRDDVIKKLTLEPGKQIEFRLFLDTNVLFSFLDLHENPSNEAARELREIVDQLGGNPKITFYVTPPTIDEAKGAIRRAKQTLSGLADQANITNAALRMRFSGMNKRFLEERGRREGSLSAEDWFDPYLNDFLTMARANGIELYNASFDDYLSREEVLNDVSSVTDFERQRAMDWPDAKEKHIEQIQHDVVLWHHVNNSRSAYVESPVDAIHWILTIDFRFLGFDHHKQQATGSSVPVCLHPTSLIQLLQFWVPRNAAFEEAVLGSIRLPFLFQELDSNAERTSLRILDGIGRFENSENIPEDAIVKVALNEALRARISEGQDEDTERTLIRDELVETMASRVHDEVARVQVLEQTAQLNASKITDLDSVTWGKDTEIEQLTKALRSEKGETADLRKETEGYRDRLTTLETKLDAIEQTDASKKALRLYFLLLFTIVLASTGIAWAFIRLIPLLSSFLGSILPAAMIWGISFVVLHILLERLVRSIESMNKLWPFRQVIRFRRWLWGSVIVVIILGFIASFQANRAQSNIDDSQGQQDISSQNSG